MNPRIHPASRGVPARGASTPRSSLLAPRALTLVEMLIGMAITLVMMAAVVNLFANIGAGVRIRRATMEMSGELRMMRATLFNDLAGATCRALPWQRPDEDPGYIEIVEGELEDSNPTDLTLNLKISQLPGSQVVDPNRITDASGLGDYDDVLALTVRNETAPFKGRARSVREGGDPTVAGDWIDNTIESNVAEVIWYAVENPADGSLGEPGMRTIYRRVLLVAPSYGSVTRQVPPPPSPGVQKRGSDPRLDLSGVPPANRLAALRAFQLEYDISVRLEGDRLVPNSLGDLSKRENRFAHLFDPALPSGGFPHVLMLAAIRSNSYATVPPDTDGPLRPFGPKFETLTDRQGEDVMLSNVLAFDVRVFDPGAPLFEYPLNSNTIVEPVGINVYSTAGGTFFADVVNNGNLVGFGAYVDLGWDDNYDYPINANNPLTHFQEEREAGWHPSVPVRGHPCVYDTWSYHYEHDGLDQDNDGLIDEGTNGLDDDGLNGVDDLLERETSPPYPVPLRGMQVKIRIYEPDTRQIREATVTRNFVPQ